MRKEVKEKVLYQKLGSYWYAFSYINGEIVFTRVGKGLMKDIKN